MRPRDVVHAIAMTYGIPTATIYGRDRTPPVAHARAAAIAALREHTDMSYPEIGRLLGRDHSTIIAAERNDRHRPVAKVCVHADCDRPPSARGLCQPCYRRAHRRGVLPPRRRAVHVGVTCLADGCDRPPKGRGYCGGHYQRLLKDGEVRADVPLGPGPGVVTRTRKVESAQHGTLSGYQSGCGCDDCRAAKQAHTAKQRRGETDRCVSTMRARRHVDGLLAAGMTGRQIARVAGVSPPTIDRLKSATKMLATSEARVLAVVKPCEDCDDPALSGGRWCQVGGCRPTGRWSWSRRAA